MKVEQTNCDIVTTESINPIDLDITSWIKYSSFIGLYNDCDRMINKCD